MIHFTKNTTATSDLGSKFEYGMCALVYLRLLGSRNPFLLGSNMSDLGKFDDIFIKDDQSQVFFVQLKHKENSSKPRTLNKKEGDFSFSSYYKSYCEVEDSLRVGHCTGNLKLVEDVPFDHFLFILYCNHPVKHNSINVLKLSSMIDMLSTGGSKGKVFSFNQDDPEVKNFLSEGKDFKRRCIFLSKLIIFSNQGSAEDVLQLVKHLVAERTHMAVEDSEGISLKYLQHIVSWWAQRISVPFLTQYPPQWFTDLDIRPSSLLALESVVEFQGQEVPLSELCKQEILTKEIIMAVRNRIRIRLGNRLPSGVKFYVSRKLQHQTVLKANVLEEALGNDLLAVTNCPSDQKLSSSAVKISGDRDEYLKLCKTEVDRNVHWVFLQGQLLIWRETHGDDHGVKPYVDVLSDRCTQTAGVCSHEVSLDEKWEGKLRLVTGQSGMGKSSLLKQLALDRKVLSPSSWVVFLPLNDYTGILRDMNKREVTFNNVVDLLHKATSDCNSMFPDMERSILVHSLRTIGNVYIFLDAVDEVSPTFKDTTLKLVQIIKEQMRVRELWITSRTVLEGTLKDKLSCVPLVLQPFTRQQQIHYLHQRGIASCEAEHVWQQLSSPGRHICDVPLHVQLLADIIPSLKLDTSVLNINVPNLYEKFFIMKHDIYYYEKMKQDRTNVSVEEEKDEKLWNFFHLHMNYALLSLLDAEQCELLNINRIEENENFDIDGMRKQRLGIIEGGSYDSIKFVHISYAEYLVARWFKQQYERELNQMLKSPCSSNHSRYYKLLIDWGLKNVQFILDQMLTEKCQLHEMVLKGDVGSLKQLLIERPGEVNQVDAGGRNALHLAVLYTRLDMIDLLLKAGCATYMRDKLMAWRPISYADCTMSWQAIVALLRYEKETPALEIFEREVPEKLTRQSIIIASKVGNRNTDNMFQTLGYKFSNFSEIDALYLTVAAGDLNLLKKMLICKKYLKLSSIQEVGGSSYERTLLHEAVACGNIEVLSFLLQEGAEVNARDFEGSTALHYSTRLGHRNAWDTLRALQTKVHATGDDKLETAGNKYLEIVHYLLDKGASIQARDQDGHTPLYWAVLGGYLEIVQCLLNKGADIHSSDQYGRTPLHLSTKNGHLAIVHFLLNKEVSKEATDKYGRTPLHLAALNGHLIVVQCLLDKEANIQASDNFGWTPLHWAAMNGHLEIVQCLLDKGSDIHSRDQYGRTPLYRASMNGHLEIVKCLLDKGADIQASDEDGQTPLHRAAGIGHLEIVQCLLDVGADTQAGDGYGRTPLHRAAQNGHLDIVQCLLGKGADTQAGDGYGRTPLHRAAENEHPEIVQCLLGKAVNIQTSDEDGQTPLHWAALKGHLEILQYLLDNGADIEASDQDGYTPLHMAAMKGHQGMVKCLLDNGADIHASDKCGRTPLHMAALKGHLEIVHCLLDNMANIEASDNCRWTPLHWAALMGHLEIVECLLAKEAAIQACDQDGQTPLHLAVENGHLEIVQYLLMKGASKHGSDQDGDVPQHTLPRRDI